MKILTDPRHNLMTHRYEDAAKWFLRMRETNNWSHGLYTYIAGICYAELSRHSNDLPEQSSEYASKANQLLESVPSLIGKRKATGGRRIPFEQFVERKFKRFKSRAGTAPIVEGITGPVSEEVMYLLCNGQKRMGANDLEKSWKSLELWSDIEGNEEELIALEFMRSVVDRNAGRLDDARERLERRVIADSLNKRVPLGSNDWVAGYTYYEVCHIIWFVLLTIDGGDKLAAEEARRRNQRMVETSN